MLLKLAPELKEVLEKTATPGERREPSKTDDQDVFGNMAIDDFRVADVAFEAGSISPSQALLRALCCFDRKNVALTKSRMTMTSRRVSKWENEYKMSAGPFSTTVIHKDQLKAKYLCAQKILKLMHPDLQSYVEILKLYGVECAARVRQNGERQRSIRATALPAVDKEPNWAMLEMLKTEMLKLIPTVPGALSSIRYT